MSMHEERNIVITMNPDELRALADKMESMYAKSEIGDSKFVDFLGYTPNLKVCLHYDQWFFEQKEKLKDLKIVEVGNDKS
tara:strand:+ start:11792 stop:12031 length:240 start_codon:yes stop_codon:yes gene_type:complete